MNPNEDLKQSRQIERLKYIDLCAYVLGYVNRKLIMDRFDVSGAYASRDIIEYQKRSDERLKMDNRLKRYVLASYFSPMFEHDIKDALQLVSQGTYTQSCLNSKQIPATTFLTPTIHPELTTIAPILRALCTSNKADVIYFSRSSGKTQRLIVPHTLFCFGHFYYIRAFDHKSGEFRSFKLNRFLESHAVEIEVTNSMKKEQDMDWQTQMNVTIGVNPNASHPETIEFDYGLTKGKKVLKVTRALLPYYLSDWNIAPKDYDTPPPELFPLIVLDTEVL